ncbi:Ltp family lipoprotein [Mycobacterium sp. C3-094]
MTQPRAGWYPDPADPSRQRYFDGTTWTENYAPFGPPLPAVGHAAKPAMSRSAKIVIGVAAGFFALIVVGSLGDSNEDKTSSSLSSSSATTSRTLSAAPTSAAPAETVEAPQPRFSPAQENAIKKAQSYLDYTAFSRQGLIEQLEYSDFDTADAEFAVHTIEADGGVDWNEQAVKKAESYLEYTSFSLRGLIEQLEYSGFTPSEAQYGANAAYGG